MVRMLPSVLSVVLIRVFARVLKIEQMSVNGEYGLVTGSPSDTAVFAEYLTTKTYSREIVSIITDFFTAHGGRGTFIDIGTNIGLTLRPVSEHFADVICHGFEPEPINFGFLSRNLDWVPGEGNVQLHNYALASEDS